MAGQNNPAIKIRKINKSKDLIEQQQQLKPIEHKVVEIENITVKKDEIDDIETILVVIKEEQIIIVELIKILGYGESFELHDIEEVATDRWVCYEDKDMN